MTGAALQQTDLHQMSCMEIWGGISAANQTIHTPGLDVHVFSEPHKGSHEGGDVHYVSMCGGGNISRFLLADVAGHGQSVGQIASHLRKLLRRNINNPDTSSLARAINDEFSALSSEGRFATALLTTYFAPTRQLIIVNAGHPRPMWYRAEAGQWEILDGANVHTNAKGPANLPLGIVAGTDYKQFAVTLAEGDIVLMFTDSLTEASDPDRQMLGEQGLLRLTREVPIHGQEQSFSQRLLDRIHDYRGRGPSDDDLTLVALHHTASGVPRYGLGEKLTVLAKLIGIVPV